MHRDNDASRIHAAGPSNVRDLWSRIKATTTHAAALSLTRNAFTTKFVNPLSAAKFHRSLLVGGPNKPICNDRGYNALNI